MGRRLAKSVTLMNDSGEFVTHRKGEREEDLDDDIVERITNPAAWAVDLGEDDEPERDPKKSWPPDGGFDVMSQVEIFNAANSTSSTTGRNDDQEEPRTAKNTGSFDASRTYEGLTVPQLRAMAVERDLEVTGLTRKQEFVDLLNEADRSDAGN